MSLLEKFHEEYECEGDFVLFRCTECGRMSMSLGSIHAHCEYDPFKRYCFPN